MLRFQFSNLRSWALSANIFQCRGTLRPLARLDRLASRRPSVPPASFLRPRWFERPSSPVPAPFSGPPEGEFPALSRWRLWAPSELSNEIGTLGRSPHAGEPRCSICANPPYVGPHRQGSRTSRRSDTSPFLRLAPIDYLGAGDASTVQPSEAFAFACKVIDPRERRNLRIRAANASSHGGDDLFDRQWVDTACHMLILAPMGGCHV